MTVEYFADHATRGPERIIKRYRTPRTSALLASWLAEVQVLEDVYWDLLVERSIDTAVGAQLDVLGAVVGQDREGRNDGTYRVWIAARALVSRSSGTAPQIIAIVKRLIGGAPVRVIDYYPASFVVDIGPTAAPQVGAAIAQLVREAKAAGVGFQMLWQTPSAGSTSFRFAPADVPVPASPHGFDAGKWRYASDGESAFAVPFEFNARSAAAGFNQGALGDGAGPGPTAITANARRRRRHG